MCDLSPHKKDTTRWMKLLGRPNNEKIRRYNNSPQAGYLVWPPFKFPQSRQNVNTDLSMFIHKISSAIYLPLKLLASYFHILLSNLKTRNVKYIQ